MLSTQIILKHKIFEYKVLKYCSSLEIADKMVQFLLFFLPKALRITLSITIAVIACSTTSALWGPSSCRLLRFIRVSHSSHRWAALSAPHSLQLTSSSRHTTLSIFSGLVGAKSWNGSGKPCLLCWEWLPLRREYSPYKPYSLSSLRIRASLVEPASFTPAWSILHPSSISRSAFSSFLGIRHGQAPTPGIASSWVFIAVPRTSPSVKRQTLLFPAFSCSSLTSLHLSITRTSSCIPLTVLSLTLQLKARSSAYRRWRGLLRWSTTADCRWRW